MKKGLGELLNEIAEAYENDLRLIDEYCVCNSNTAWQDSKEDAKGIIKAISEEYGVDFIMDVLMNEVSAIPISIQVKAMYDKLLRDNPSMMKQDIREKIANHFKVTDKAVQKHIYTGRK